MKRIRRNNFLSVCFILAVAFLAAGITSCAKMPQKLEKPQNLNIEKRVMTWDKVDGAADYTVKIRDEEFKTAEPRFDLYFLTEAGNYYYQVKACGDGEKYTDSSWIAGATTLTQAPEHGYDELKFEYTLLKDKSGYEVSRGEADLAGEITIPDYFGDYPVKRIAGEAFYMKKYKGTVNGVSYYDYPDCLTGNLCNKTTTRVQLPSQLQSIGEYAMSCMTKLKEVVLPDTVMQVGKGAFDGNASMERVVLPENITVIPDDCFKNTALSEIKFPQKLEVIGSSAFKCATNNGYGINHVNSALQRVVLPTSIKTIGANAFFGRENLTAISFPDGHSLEFVGVSCIRDTALYTQQEGIVFLDENKTIACGFNKMPSDFTFEIPANVKYVTQYAFAVQRNLKKVVLPSGIKFLGGNTFSSCSSLEEVVFPSDFGEIVDGMFSLTVALKTISIPESVTCIGGSAFSQSGLEYVKLPSGLKAVKTCTFFMCNNLKDITIPSGVETIEQQAFYKCTSLQSITLSKALKTLGKMAFSRCAALKSVVIPSSVEKIEERLFASCQNLTNVFYEGNFEKWTKIAPDYYSSVTNEYSFSDATIYYYSAEEIKSGNYWHYAADGVTPEIW